MSSVEIFPEIEQGSPEWFAIRAGLPTASMFAAVLAKGEGKTRRKYLLTLAGERLTGEPAESYTNEFMERGQRMEDEARQMYAFMHDADPVRVGFVRNIDKGYSPDSLLGESGLLEVKTKRADILIEVLLKDEVPPEHKAQIQGGLWVAEREWIDFVGYWPGLPLFVKRVCRDETYIATLAKEVAAFNAELAQTVERIRAMERRAAA